MFPFPDLLAVNILVELTTIWMILQSRRRPYQILRIKQRDAFLIVGLHILLRLGVKEDSAKWLVSQWIWLSIRALHTNLHKSFIKVGPLYGYRTRAVEPYYMVGTCKKTTFSDLEVWNEHIIF